MNARSLMRQRCVIERRIAEGTGQTWQAHLTQQPCQVAVVGSEDLEIQPGWSIPVGKYTLLLPADTDIEPGDRVGQVLDRLEETTVLAGPLSIDTVTRHADHLAVVAIAVSGPANAKLLALLTPGVLAGNGDPGEFTPTWEGEAAGFMRRIDSRTPVQGREQQESGRTTLALLDTVGTLPVEAANAVRETERVIVEDRTLGTIQTSQWAIKAITRYHKSGINFTVLDLDMEAPR